MYPDHQKLEKLAGEKILKINPLASGGFSQSLMIETDQHTYFAKTYVNPEMVEAELLGLNMIEATNSFGVPHVIATDATTLMMEYVETSTPQEGYWMQFAQNLCKLHRNTHASFGLSHQTYCGPTPQVNDPTTSWNAFFVQCRMLPLVQKLQHTSIAHLFAQKRGKIEDVLDQVDEPPSLVHGDLWAGNHLCGPEGTPMLIDPAIYYGHRETDLAMMKLFGGFPDAVFDYYESLWPLQQGKQTRLIIYQLYHMLNHALLFGGHYVHQCEKMFHAP